MLKPCVATSVVGVTKVELRRIGAERLTASAARGAGLVDGEELGAQALVLAAVATLAGRATSCLPLLPARLAGCRSLAAAWWGGDERSGRAGRAGRGAGAWSARDGLSPQSSQSRVLASR